MSADCLPSLFGRSTTRSEYVGFFGGGDEQPAQTIKSNATTARIECYSFASMMNSVPRTPIVEIGVFTAKCWGECRGSSPVTTESTPFVRDARKLPSCVFGSKA